jgi:hypothetical protein
LTDRRDLLRLTGFLVALLVVTGAILLATSGGSSSKKSNGLAGGQGQVDGRVLVAEPTKLVLKPASGGADMTFAIRATEAPNFDVFHLQQHAADGLLTRVTYIEEDGTLYALRADDAPEPAG